MPIYEFECDHHGIFEAYFPKIIDVDSSECLLNPDCTFECPLIVSLPSIRPDKMWSGIENQFGYFTSESQYKKFLKDKNIVPADRDAIDHIAKRKTEFPKELQAKQDKARTEFLESELRNVEITPDNAFQARELFGDISQSQGFESDTFEKI